MTREELIQIDRLLASYFDPLKKAVEKSTPDMGKIPAPQVHVSVPEVKVPTVVVPEIKVPEIQVPVIPPIVVPPITVPTPEVTVNVDHVTIDNLPEPAIFDDSKIVDGLKKLLEAKSGGSGGPSEYKDGGKYDTRGLFGIASMWDDGGTMRSISATKPLPVNIVSSIADEVHGNQTVAGAPEKSLLVGGTWTDGEGNYPDMLRQDPYHRLLISLSDAGLNPIEVSTILSSITGTPASTLKSLDLDLVSIATKQTDGSQKTQINSSGGVTINPAKEDGNLASIKTKTDNLDITLSALRDALRGASNKTLTDIVSALASVSVTQSTATNLKTQAEAYQGGTAVGSGNPLYVQAGPSATFALGAGSNFVGKMSVGQDTAQLYNGTSTLTPAFAAISASSSGDNSVVSADVSKKIRVLGVWVIANGAVNAKFRKATTDITGLAYLAQNGGWVLPFNPVGWFETGTNQALNINLSSAVAVGGSVVYVLV